MKAARSSRMRERKASTRPTSSTLACQERNLPTCSSTISSARGISLSRAPRFCWTARPGRGRGARAGQRAGPAARGRVRRGLGGVLRRDRRAAGRAADLCVRAGAVLAEAERGRGNAADGKGHPLLGTTTELADSGEVILTGRLSLRAQPWIGDHKLGGMVLFPGTGFLELAMRAAEQSGCGRVAELTLTAPMLLSADDVIEVQVRVASAGETGARQLRVFGRPRGADGESWTEHASGMVAPGTEAARAADTGAWPPEGAVAIDVAKFYAGTEFGPSFRGPARAVAARRRGGVRGGGADPRRGGRRGSLRAAPGPARRGGAGVGLRRRRRRRPAHPVLLERSVAARDRGVDAARPASRASETAWSRFRPWTRPEDR